MKRKDKKRIIVELIVIILYCVDYYIYKGKTLPFIGALPSPIQFISGVLLLFHGKDIKDCIKEWRKPASSKVTSIVALEVKNTGELEVMADNRFFMENPAVGKIGKERRTWRDVKKEIDFSKLQPVDLSSYQHGVFFIIGKPGAGKSTYMLWSLDKFLEKKSWWRPAKKKIVFLDPKAYTSWAEELTGYDSGKTLLVIDALYRLTDTDEIFRDRCSHLFKLAFGQMKTEDDETIGPFKVLATIREDEYKKLLSQGKFEPTDKYLITPERLAFKKILERLLFSYGVLYYTEELRELDEEDIIKQSDGLPFYIRLLAICLKETKEKFSKDTLRKFPPGVANLIWDTINKRYYLKDDIAIPFLLLLLSTTDKYFSGYFLNFVKDILAQENLKEEIAEKIRGLSEMYFQSPKDSKEIIYALSSHWKDSIHIGLEQPDKIFSPYRGTVESYREISNMHFNRLLEKIADELRNRLQEGFKDKADDSLCVDLAKLSEPGLVYATDIYNEFCSSQGFSSDYNKYVQEELYELWISNAWNYRAVHNDSKVIDCYENAFDRLGVRSHPKQLHAYAFYLQKRVLPRCNDGTPEWQKYKEQIEKLYKDAIEIQLRQDAKEDPVSYQGLASFYKEVGEKEKAEEAFEKALQIDSRHVPTKQEYAIFLKSIDDYERAENQFKQAIKILEEEKKKTSSLKIKETEKKVLNAYALFCRDNTKRYGKKLSEEEKINGYKKVDDLFNELLRKYPDHSQSITAYSRFLMDDAAVLKKYESGENLRKAEECLKDFITSVEENKATKDLSYFIALHILALYYYRSDYEEYRGKPLFREAEDLLKKSSKSFDPFHNSVAYSELGRLYAQWAKILEESNLNDFCEKINLAEEAYEEAKILPENLQSASHLTIVYSNYAFYFQYTHHPRQSEECVQKALELVDKYSVYAPDLYYSLTTLGENFLKDYTLDPALKIFSQAANLGSSYGINPSFAIYRLGEIYKQKGEVEKASEYYLQSARLQNTSEDYRISRSSIKDLMDDYHIDPWHHYYNTCMQARKECSEKAYKLDPNSWPNCGNYGEDLFKVRRDKEAIPILEKGIELLQQSKELNEAEKKEYLKFFYYFLEKIERRRRDDG